MGNFLRRLFGRKPALPDVTDEEIEKYQLKPGGLYCIGSEQETGEYGAVKILVMEPQVVHLCVFRNKFPARPETLEMDELQLGMSEEEFRSFMEAGDDGASPSMGIAHLPIHVRDFIYGWQPVLAGEAPVGEDELEGYRYWKQEGGGVFGGQ